MLQHPNVSPPQATPLPMKGGQSVAQTPPMEKLSEAGAEAQRRP